MNKNSRRWADADHRIRKKLKPTKYMDSKESPVGHGPGAFMHDQKVAKRKAEEKAWKAILALEKAAQAAKNDRTDDRPHKKKGKPRSNESGE